MKLMAINGKRWAVGALLLIGVVIGVAVQPAATSHAQVVTAAPEWKSCYDLSQRYKDGFIYANLSTADQAIIQGCFNIAQDNGSASTANGTLQSTITTSTGVPVCATQKQDATGKVLITCIDPIAYENAPIVPVVNVLCSQYLDYYGNGGTQYTNCETATQNAYKACYVPVATGGSTGYIQPLIVDVATCIKQKTKSTVDTTTIATAITAGETALAKVVTDGTAAIRAKLQKECLARGGTWDDKITDNTLACTEKITAAPTSTCTVQSIGWIVCPVMKFMGKILDDGYSAISALTSTPANILSDPAKQAWSIFRDLANIILVIAFMIIVFSQITGGGASNYGIKKMLPKLIIVAILINVSFFLCQLAVDLSNVVGAGVYSLLKNLPVYQSSTNILDSSTMVADVVTAVLGYTAIGVAGAAVGVAGVAIATTQGALVVLIPVIIAALAAILVTVVVLVMRPALVIILTVVAPVAIATTLLPNLQSVYKKWQQYFVATLILFPMISLLFGGAQLAAAILIQSMGMTVIDAGSIGKNIGAFISVIVTMNLPLLAVLPMIKGSLNAIPLLGKASQAITDGGRKLSGFTSGKLKENAGLIAAYAQRNPGNKFAQKLSSGVHGRGITLSRRIPKIGGKTFGGAQATLRAANAAKSYNDAEVAAAAYNTQDTLVGESVDAAVSGTLKGKPLSQMEHLAIIDKAVGTGGFKDRQRVIAKLSQGDMGDPQQRELVNRAIKLAYSKGDQTVYGVGFGDDVLSGKIKGEDGLRSATLRNILGGNVDGTHMVQGQSAAEFMIDVAKGEKTVDGKKQSAGQEDKKAVAILNDAVKAARAGDSTKTTASGAAYARQFERIDGRIKDVDVAHTMAIEEDEIFNTNHPGTP